MRQRFFYGELFLAVLRRSGRGANASAGEEMSGSCGQGSGPGVLSGRSPLF